MIRTPMPGNCWSARASRYPSIFTGPALAALAAAARSDPRLAAAQEARDAQVTQFLAGVPVLLERYRTAPPVARAVIDAALDARTLGHGPALPHALLEAAAPGYLTDQRWEEDAGEDWLEQALAYTAESCRGVRGPLTRIRPRPGQPTSSQPCYRLADYLEQTSRAGRQGGSAPASLWDALLAHARREDLPWIAAKAWDRGLYRYAFQLYVAAGDAGHIAALGQAAEMLRRLGRTEDAIAMDQQAAKAGDLRSLNWAALMLQRAGRTEEALAFSQQVAARYQQVAEAGDPRALAHAAGMLEEAGRTEEALTFYQQAAEAGDPRALAHAAGMLEEAGRTEEALTFYQQAAEAGDPSALAQAAGMLQKAGRTKDAARLGRYGIEPGGRIADPWEASVQA